MLVLFEPDLLDVSFKIVIGLSLPVGGCDLLVVS